MSDFGRLVSRALVKAQRVAQEENDRFNLPLIVMKNGRIVHIPPKSSIKRR